MPSTRTSHRAYRRKRAKTLREQDVCAWCGRWIDPELKHPDPWSASADHVVPVSLGGDNLGELQAMHLKCNLERGNGTRSSQPERHGRDW